MILYFMNFLLHKLFMVIITCIIIINTQFMIPIHTICVLYNDVLMIDFCLTW